MTVLDTYAVIAFLQDEPAASEVRPMLQTRDALLTAVGLGEFSTTYSGGSAQTRTRRPSTSPNLDSSTPSPPKPRATAKIG